MNKSMILFTLVALGSLQVTAGEADKRSGLFGRIRNFFRQDNCSEKESEGPAKPAGSYILPIGVKDSHPNSYTTTTTDEYADLHNPNSHLLFVIQRDDNLKKCIRLVVGHPGTEDFPPQLVNDMPVQEATKDLIAQKINIWPTKKAYAGVRCHTSEYDFFIKTMARLMQTRTGNKKDIEKAQMRSLVISEVPLQEVHEDIRKYAQDSLSRYEAQLQDQKCPQEKQDDLLRSYRSCLERWQKAPSRDVVYTDKFHDQSEKED